MLRFSQMVGQGVSLRLIRICVPHSGYDSYFSPCTIIRGRPQAGCCCGSGVVSGGPVLFTPSRRRAFSAGLRGKRKEEKKKKQGADRHDRPRLA